jgi:hypothetical protein
VCDCVLPPGDNPIAVNKYNNNNNNKQDKTGRENKKVGTIDKCVYNVSRNEALQKHGRRREKINTRNLDRFLSVSE